MPKLLLAVLCASSLLLPGVARAHDEHPFEPVSDIAGMAPVGRALFFPLAADFDEASPLALVPAAGRRVQWTPDATQLPEAALTTPAMRAIGLPPPQPEAARYLVPVLDGAGSGLSFVPRRLEGGRLVPFAAGSPEPTSSTTNVVPILVGPQLASATGSALLDRVLEDPVVVDPAALTDPVPALLVRRAPPGRVVFGIRLSSPDYVPLVDETGLAVMAEHKGKRGLAVTLPAGVEVRAATPSVSDADRDDDKGGRYMPGAVVAALVVFAVAALVLLVRRRRRS